MLLFCQLITCCSLAAATDLSHLPKEIPLREMASGSPNLSGQSLSNLKEAEKDCCSQDSLMLLYAVSTIFAAGVTLALILHFFLGERLVCHTV